MIIAMSITSIEFVMLVEFDRSYNFGFFKLFQIFENIKIKPGGETSDGSHLTIGQVVAKVPENGSKDFFDFLHEVRAS